MDSQAEIGVFGGSGFYSLLEDVEEIKVETPYGAPSDKLALGTVAGRKVAFLPRHGKSHQYPPHMIPYRANVYAMKELGVTRIIGANCVGSLQPDLKPGDFVVCDQFMDRTSGRRVTFYDGPWRSMSRARSLIARDASLALEVGTESWDNHARWRHVRDHTGAPIFDPRGEPVVHQDGLVGGDDDPVSRVRLSRWSRKFAMRTSRW